MIVDGLITKAFKDKEGEHEIQFFFGILTFKLLAKEMDLPFEQVQPRLQQIADEFKEDPISAMDLVVNTVWYAHKAACVISDTDPIIKKGEIWVLLETWGPEKFIGVLKEGLLANKSAEIPQEEEEEPKKKAIPQH